MLNKDTSVVVVDVVSWFVTITVFVVSITLASEEVVSTIVVSIVSVVSSFASQVSISVTQKFGDDMVSWANGCLKKKI